LLLLLLLKMTMTLTTESARGVVAARYDKGSESSAGDDNVNNERQRRRPAQRVTASLQ